MLGRHWRATVVLVCAAVAAALLPTGPGGAQTSPYVAPGFAVTEVLSGLELPTAVAFAPGGRIFVAERAGRVLTTDGPQDPTPTVVADLTTRVFAGGDRGLLGLATDPRWPASPYVYLLYTHDGPVGSTAPVYGDRCATPSGWNADGCPAHGILSRIPVASDGTATGPEQILVGGMRWCTGWQAHAVDHIAFGPDGALYASAGEGATSQFSDFGQHTGSTSAPTPPNPCGDPPAPVGSHLTAPTSQGGALRAQDLLTPGDPTSYEGTIIRLDPDTGAAMPDNPLTTTPTADDDAVIAFGLRNPFRFTFRPGTSELWVGDVGLNSFEEINRITDPTDPVVENFGWPCYEGLGRQVNWEPLGMELCEGLYAGQMGPVTPPAHVYAQRATLDPGRCEGLDASVSGLAFAPAGGPYPPRMDGGLFVGDYSKGCLWVLPAGADGLPSATGLETILSGVFPVDVEIGPDGHLWLVDLIAGTLARVGYAEGNEAPRVDLQATPTSGPLPLEVVFDASATTDDGGTADLRFTWDLDGDGAHDDATGPTTRTTYVDAGAVIVEVRVVDASGAVSTATTTIHAGNSPPQVTISQPAADHRWTAGVQLSFAGSATDPDDGPLPPSTLTWQVVLHHCDQDGDCHEHPQLELAGVDASTVVAPEHEHPAHLELRLTATDGQGLTATASTSIQPRTVAVTLQSDPPGLTLSAGGTTAPAPVGFTAIAGSRTTITAPATQEVDGRAYTFSAWSDGGPRTHEVSEPGDVPTATYIATYTADVGAGTAMLVSRDVALPGADAIVRNRLQGLGFDVSVVDDDALSATAAAAVDLVVVSSTVASAKVGTRLRQVATPVLVYDEGAYDDLWMTAPSAFGRVSGQTQVDVVGTHPASAGLSGLATTTTRGEPYSWGSPAPGAQVLARIAGSPSRAAAFTYDRGAAMASGTAPARRSAYFLDSRTALRLTPAGWALFDALVTWTAGGSGNPPEPSNAAPSVSAGPDQQVVLPGQATLQGQVTDDGLPVPPGRTTSGWTVSSGPGPVSFADATAPVTQVSFGEPGRYVLRLRADDGALATTDDVVVDVAASPGGGDGRALLVSRDLTLPGGDAAVAARLEGLGFTVSALDDDGLTAEVAAGADLVVVSSTTYSGKVGGSLRSVATPVVIWNEAAFDDLAMTAPSAFGVVADQTQVDVVDGHPAAGTPGRLTVSGVPEAFAWGAPATGAQVLARLVSGAGPAAAFTYEVGAVMASGTAPARRAGLFLDNRTALYLTEDGWGLFDRIIQWAAGG